MTQMAHGLLTPTQKIAFIHVRPIQVQLHLTAVGSTLHTAGVHFRKTVSFSRLKWLIGHYRLSAIGITATITSQWCRLTFSRQTLSFLLLLLLLLLSSSVSRHWWSVCSNIFTASIFCYITHSFKIMIILFFVGYITNLMSNIISITMNITIITKNQTTTIISKRYKHWLTFAKRWQYYHYFNKYHYYNHQYH